MKYIYHCIIPFLVLCVDLHAQQIISNSLVESGYCQNQSAVDRLSYEFSGQFI